MTAIWPPTGLALAAVLIGGRRMWPGVALGALLANITTAGGLGTVLGIATGNTLEALCGAYLLSRVGFRRDLERMRDVVALVGLAAVLSTMVSATIGVLSLWQGGLLPADAIASTWRVWWLGDMGGDLLIAPLILVLVGRPRIELRIAWAAEALALALALTVVSALVFPNDSALAYAAFPLIFWTALRFRQTGAVLAGLVVSGFAVWYTARGYGPFVGDSPDADLLRAQTFVGVATITALLVAAVRSERLAAEQALAELSRSERLLAEAEERFRSAFEEAPIGIALMAPDGRWLRVNSSLCEIVGYSAEELLAGSFQEIAHAAELEYVRKLLAGEIRTYRTEKRCLHKRGHVVWVMLSVSLVRDSAGAPLHFISQVEDISARKQAERELETSERRFRTLTQESPVGVFLTDPEGLCTFVNSRWLECAGISHEQAMGDGWARAIHPDDRARATEQWYAAAAGGPEFALEARFMAPDGRITWFTARAVPLRDERGEVVEHLGTVTDITERKRVEHALREAEERFRRVFEESPVGICLVGENFGFQQVNEAFCSLTGYTHEELQELTFAEITHPDDLATDAKLADQLFSGEIPSYQIEKRYITKGGEPVWIALTAGVLRGEDGSPLYGVGMVENIDERRRFEERLQHFADHDSLTGLYNRRRFEQELERQVAHEARYGRGAALLLVDVDAFKHVNDSLGHKLGDELLVAVGALMRARLRSTDIVARIGGDEFVALLPEVDEAGARKAAESLAAAIRAHEIAVGGERVRATASIGVALLGEATAEELFVHADLAMYAAKDAGRDRVVAYERSSSEDERSSRLHPLGVGAPTPLAQRRL